MKPTLYVMLLALLFSACGPVKNLQKVESKIPCLGAVGKDRSTLFKKEFRKVGEPVLGTSIGVTLNSYAFDKTSYNKYISHTKNQGKQPLITYSDSLEVLPRYYTMTITDLVGLRSQFNGADNSTLKSYMVEDGELGLLHSISFVAQPYIQETLGRAKHLYIRDQRGNLTLEAQGGKSSTVVDMSALEVFNFGTASICWTKNKMGKHQVATFLVDGRTCPGHTEKDPHKLDEVKAYLKF
ncbi:MAG: hypothetical protein AAF969_16195 [Bacteroidota bacterium]